MTLVEHLAELRDRLVRAVLALAVGTLAGYVLFPQVIDVIAAPYCDIQTIATPTGECSPLLGLGVLEPFQVRIKTALVVGFLITGPVIFYQLWRFITPGLTTSERRYALPFVVLSQVMFVLGLAFSYVVIPQGLEILLGFGGDAIVPALSANQYLSFFLATSLAFGVVFEVPLVLIFLALVGVVSSGGLRRFRRYALVINVVVAAVVTPSQDAVTLLFMAGPMALFYEVAIAAAWLIERRRARRAAR